MANDSPRELIERLYVSFTGIYNKEAAQGGVSYARQLIEDDVLLLGQFFGAVDPIEARTTTSLLAECVAYLRVKSSPLQTESVIELQIEQVMAELSAHPLDPVQFPKLDTPQEVVDRLQTLRFAKNLRQKGLISADEDTTLRAAFLELANCFLLRDGNVTAKEMDAIRLFDSALNG